jgi:spore maturation protein CgeB
MKILRISTINPAYLNKFFTKNPGIDEKTYEEQLSALFYDAYAQADSFSHYLAKLGYECREVVTNALTIQKAWSRQNDAPWDKSNYIKTCTIEYAKQFKPEIVFLNNFDYVDELRSKCPSIRLVVGFFGVSPTTYDNLKKCDIVLTPVLSLARQFAAVGLNTKILPHAFDPRVLDRINNKLPKIFPLTFIGGVQRANDFHKSRARFFEKLSENTSLTIFTSNASEALIKQFVRVASYGLFTRLRTIGFDNRALARFPLIGNCALLQVRPRCQKEHSLWSSVRPAVYGLEMYNALVQSKVTLNMHAECAGNSAGNIRLFEATGVGTCLVTDYKDDLHLMFDPEYEVVTYKSIDECKEKLKWLSEHPDKRNQIAMAGMNRTLKSHTYEKRAALLDEIFREHC